MQTLRRLVMKLALVAVMFGVTAATTFAQSSLQDPPGKPPVRVSEGVMMGNLERRIEPKWPDGQTPQGNGVIVLHAIVRTDGTVRSVEVVSGETPFCEPALLAVKQWGFKPYLLNGERVEVETDVTMRVPGKQAETQAPAGVVRRARISGGVMAGQTLVHSSPVYPREAREQHIQGSVVMRAIIGDDGAVRDLQVMSGPDELRQAAIDAVSHWRYRPYLLNGQPVEVETTVTINFNLAP